MDEARQVELEEPVLLPDKVYVELPGEFKVQNGRVTSKLTLASGGYVWAITAGTMTIGFHGLYTIEESIPVIVLEEAQIKVDSAWWRNPGVNVVRTAQDVVNEVLRQVLERVGGFATRKRWFPAPEIEFKLAP